MESTPEVEVRPEPPAEEREVLCAAVEVGPAVPPLYTSPWRLAALREGAERNSP